MGTKLADTQKSKNEIASESVCCAVASRTVMTADEATRTASLFKVLGDPIRLRIVSLVAAADSGEICACDLPALLDRSQGTVSHHLTQLVEARILAREQRGKWAWFRLNEATLKAISEALVPAER
jgi:ArsR family transcriptional regulator, arsenate/arsenite/antimonite-responsive transcriptional repressor